MLTIDITAIQGRYTQNMKNFIKRVTKRKEFKIVSALVTIGLTLFDMGSDLLLAANYASTGKDDWWFALTLTFFLIPFTLILLLILGFFCLEDEESFVSIFKDAFPYWKQLECTFESGPQLILQLYIMSLPSMNTDDNVNNDRETNTTINVNTTLGNQTELIYVTQPTSNYTEAYENITVSNNYDTDENNIEDMVTLALQVFVLVTALLSISWGAVSLKKNTEQDETGEDEQNLWGTTDYICDTTWNALCISSRVIALALFASRERFWFAGVVVLHTFIFLIMYVLQTRNLGDYEDTFDIYYQSVVLAVTSNFNIILSYERSLRTYYKYLNYWIAIMIENIILITIWYTLSSGDNLWYHNPAIAYVITAYFLSFFIKTYQTYQRKDKNKEHINMGKPLSQWIC